MRCQQTKTRHAGRTALFGMLVLTLGMGIGRFLYTALLPTMLVEGRFTFDQLSWIASANYAGYLAGSLLFSLGQFHQATHSRGWLLLSAVSTSVLVLAMGIFTSLGMVIPIRFLAGVASAGMLIFGAMQVLQHSPRPWVLASLFAGVGSGIVLGNEYVNLGLRFAMTAQSLWLGAAILSGVLLGLVLLLLPPPAGTLFASASVAPPQSQIPWWQLALLYGMAGFGYIIVATYLPLMATQANNPLLTQHLWSLVGLAIIPGCYGWLWAAQRWGTLPCLSANLMTQGVCVLLTLSADNPVGLILSSVGFGATFMGTTSLVMGLAKQLKAPGNINMLGLVTLTYGIGQIIGPLLTSILSTRPDPVTLATQCGAIALFFAASISLYCLWRQGHPAPPR